MRLDIHEAAQLEIQHHYDWYAERDRRVADRLADLFEATVIEIVRDPLRYSLMEMLRNPGDIRCARLKGFPLFVLYRIKGEEVVVLAVPHTSQRPGYWKARLQN